MGFAAFALVSRFAVRLSHDSKSLVVAISKRDIAREYAEIDNGKRTFMCA